MKWVNTNDELPKHGVNVIATYTNYYDKRRVITANYIERFKEESNADDYSNDEYCEEKDNYYLKKGWYETIDN